MTGQPGVLNPVRIDATSEMLSAFVRILGCVAICRRIAESAVAELGREYGLKITEVDSVICETLVDIADGDGYAPIAAAARDLLAPTLAPSRDAPVRLALRAGPPLALEPLAERRDADDALAKDS